MQPKKLKVTAFGPYPEEIFIDFDKVLQSDLFLIFGATGSGKTTIFDAICFAMYGKASNNMRSIESLRSQFASDETLTEVTLEFTIRDMDYKITRIPPQTRPKLVGDGYTEQSHHVELIIYSNPERVVVGVKDVEEEIESIVGLTVDQFRQIMMLPQGEFRKLLVANSQERERVLQRLFDTKDYQALQTKLDERSKKIDRDIENAKINLNQRVKSLNPLDDNMLANLLEDKDINIDKILNQLDKWLIEYNSKLEMLLVDKKNVDERRVESLREEEKARVTNNKIDNLEKLIAKLQDIRKENIKFEQLRKIIKDAEKANNLTHQIEQKSKLDADLLELKERQNELDNSISESSKKKSVLEKDMSRLNTSKEQEYRDSLREEIIKLQALSVKADSLSSVKTSLQKKQDAMSKLQEDKSGLEEKLLRIESIQDELKVLHEKRMSLKTKILDAKEEFRSKEAKYKDLIKAKDLFEDIIGLEEQIDEKNTIINTLESEIKDLESHFTKVKNDYYSNQAHLLASNLNQGDQCPVCGSKHHPKLAIERDDNTTQEEFSKAEEELMKKREVKQDVLRAINNLMDKIENRKKEIKGYVLCLERFKEDYHKDIMKEKQFLAQKQSIIDSLEECLAVTTEKIEKNELEVRNRKSISEELDKLKDEFLLAEKEVDKLITQKEILKTDIPQELRSKDVILESISNKESEWSEKQKELEDTKNLLNQVKSKLEALNAQSLDNLSRIAKLENEYSNLCTNLSKNVIELGFSSLEELTSKMLDKDILTRKKEALAKYEEQVRDLKIQIESIEQELHGVEKVDILELKENTERYTVQYKELEERTSNLKQCIDINKDIYASCKKTLQEVTKQEKEYQVLGELAKVARGMKPNPLGITFERYVLAAFLEEILNAANLRLLKMTSQRYRLYRSEERERLNTQGGLEIEVYDNYTGKVRHVKTLSGGESFKAALAMALGLTEVISSYAGGVELQTMFIDEGFGTLDPESLDSAIDCLMELRDSNRKVGIISHVPELKERITTQIEIISTSSGSKIKY